MKSRITIEVDFDNKTPYIKVINNYSSDDMRDKSITYFREKLQYTSSWANIIFRENLSKPDELRFDIIPITPNEMEIEADYMAEQARINKKNTVVESTLSH